MHSMVATVNTVIYFWKVAKIVDLKFLSQEKKKNVLTMCGDWTSEVVRW